MKDLQSDFSKIFEADLIEYDSENESEWIEVFSKKDNLYVNISREHNGNPDKSRNPISIMLDFHNYKEDMLENNKKIAELISKHLDVTVSFGKSEWISPTVGYKFIVLGNYFVKK